MLKSARKKFVLRSSGTRLPQGPMTQNKVEDPQAQSYRIK